MVSLSYDDLGRGAPWMFLHGFPLSRRLWQPQRELAEGARLLLPDLRGHGASPVAATATMAEMAADVLALADKVGIDRFGVVGLSLGGYVAFEVQRAAPERVSAMVLADTQATPDSDEARGGREALARKVLEDGPRALAEGFVPKLLSPRGLADAGISSEARAMALAQEPEGMAAALRGMAQRADARPWLRDIACPVLALVGALDTVTPEAKAREIATSVPYGELRVLPDAGHLSNLESPRAFNAALKQFFALQARSAPAR